MVFIGLVFVFPLNSDSVEDFDSVISGSQSTVSDLADQQTRHLGYISGQTNPALMVLMFGDDRSVGALLPIYSSQDIQVYSLTLGSLCHPIILFLIHNLKSLETQLDYTKRFDYGFANRNVWGAAASFKAESIVILQR